MAVDRFIQKTTDGGNRWLHELSYGNANIEDMHFIDDAVAYFGGWPNSVILHTSQIKVYLA